MKMQNTVIARNPVIKTFKWVLNLMKNQFVFSLVLLVQGLLYIQSPSGDINPMVYAGSVVIGLAALANAIMHLAIVGRTKWDVVLAIVNFAIFGFAVFCIFKPSIVAPYVKYVVGGSIFIANILNLIGIFKIENKKSLFFFAGLFGAVALIVLGAFTALAPAETIEKIQRPIGIVLVFNALINFFYLYRFWRAARKKKAEAEKQAASGQTPQDPGNPGTAEPRRDGPDDGEQAPEKSKKSKNKKKQD